MASIKLSEVQTSVQTLYSHQSLEDHPGNMHAFLDIILICNALLIILCKSFISIGYLSEQLGLHSLFAKDPRYVEGSGQASLDKLPIAAKRTLNMHQNFSMILRFDIIVFI